MSQARQPDAERARLKTYSHLLSRQRIPSDYDVGTSDLLYYRERGFEVEVPATSWYERYQSGSPLTVTDWEAFNDPRQTTYARYTALQKRQETFVDGLLAAMGDTAYDSALTEPWLAILERVMAPFRYAGHGLQMLAAYVGQMAPSGKIAVAALFQVADEIRRIERFAYRMRQLQHRRPAFGADSRAVWQDDPGWQPLREAIENLLVTYDWAEAFVGLNLCLKPVIDDTLVTSLATAGQRHDPLMVTLLQALHEDCRWHQAWSAALVEMAVADRPANQAILQTWIDRWTPMARHAGQALAAMTGAAEGVVDGL